MKTYPVPTTVKVGQGATIHHDMSFVGRDPSFKCNGEVVKVTPKQIGVRNEHGNSSKFWRETGRAVGYSDSIVFI